MGDVWSKLGSLPEIANPATARAAVLVALYEDGEGVRIVLTKRPDTMRTHPGDVVFPGGMIERGEDPLAAALREAEEEIQLPRSSITEVFGGLAPITTRNRHQLIVPVVARIERPARLVPDPAEVDVIIEPLLKELLVEDRWHTNDWMGHKLWFYEFPEGILWGATAFIVRELLDHVRR